MLMLPCSSNMEKSARAFQSEGASRKGSRRRLSANNAFQPSSISRLRMRSCKPMNGVASGWRHSKGTARAALAVGPLLLTGCGCTLTTSSRAQNFRTWLSRCPISKCSARYATTVKEIGTRQTGEQEKTDGRTHLLLHWKHSIKRTSIQSSLRTNSDGRGSLGEAGELVKARYS